MGVLFGYFAATDDDDAVRAVVRDDGELSGSGYDQMVVKGIDPVVQLMPAEALLTGRSAADVRSDPRHGSLVAMVGDGDLVLLSLTDALRDALATGDSGFFAGVAADWAGAEDVFHPPADPDQLADFLGRLSELAVRAVARSAHLYCWICL
ncbi:hypothetical protein [Peterkaempfera sp. SMS 1(5)a]|uniref:hypothetical protein n=1 Tax=Peterkaempfera podocarpi TaxID=3232308 RepID=UPI00366DCA20